jgi:hypothetical protein
VFQSFCLPFFKVNFIYIFKFIEFKYLSKVFNKKKYSEKKLVLYLKQLLKTTIIIENYYQNWSYIKNTGMYTLLKY